MRSVIFDLDGTLADTGADLVASANACFRALGHGDMLDAAADRATAFRGGRAMLRLGFSRLGPDYGAADVETQFPLMLDAYGRDIARHTVLYPGVLAALDALRADGFALGICTNKPEDLAEKLLAELGVRDSFAALIGADTLPVRKPDPAPLRAAIAGAGGAADRAILVGDTETDRRTAAAAGVPAVLVTFGPDGDAVSALAPEALMGHYDELAGIARRLLGAGVR